MRALVLLVALIVGGTVSAQLASYTYINQASPCNLGRPWLVALGLPALGGNLPVQVPRGTWVFGSCSYEYFLLTGVSSPATPLSAFLPNGLGLLLASPDVVIRTPFGSPGATVIDIPVPASSSLPGARLYQQVIEVSNGPFCTRVCGGRGGVAVVGLPGQQANYNYIDQASPYSNPSPSCWSPGPDRSWERI